MTTPSPNAAPNGDVADGAAQREAALKRIKEIAESDAGKQLAKDLRSWGVTNPNAVARDLIGGLLHAGYTITPTERAP